MAKLTIKASDGTLTSKELSETWVKFIMYCTEVGYGEITELKIKNGNPVMVTEVRKNVKFD